MQLKRYWCYAAAINKEKMTDKNIECWYVLGNGIEIESQEIEIRPNLRIKRINSEMSIFDLAAIGAKGFREWTLLERLSSFYSFEIESIDDGIDSGYDVLNRAWLLNTLLVLKMKLRANCVACSSYSWNEVAGFQKRSLGNDMTLAPFKGHLLDFHTSIIQLPNLENFKINQSDIEWIKKYYETTNSLASKNSNFKFAIETINSWRYSKDLKSSITIIWAAIESIIGVSSEIVFRLSLNISSILEIRGEARLRRFNQIKKLYGLRSKVVHGSELKNIQIIAAIEESFILLCDLVIYMIENNKIITNKDFENAIFY